MLSVDLSFTCSDFLGYFLRVQKLRGAEIPGTCDLTLQFLALSSDSWRGALLFLSLVMEFLNSRYYDVFVFGFLLARGRLLRFHLNLALPSVCLLYTSDAADDSIRV